MQTYTFIVNFRGGVYCSQASAKDLTGALKKWLKRFIADRKEIKYFSDAMVFALEKELFDKEFPPLQLNNLKNAWFTHCSTKQGQVTINIIKTQID